MNPAAWTRLESKIDGLTDKVSSLSERFVRVETRTDTCEGVGDKVDGHETRITALERLEELNIGSRIERLERRESWILGWVAGASLIVTLSVSAAAYYVSHLLDKI